PAPRAAELRRARGARHAAAHAIFDPAHQLQPGARRHERRRRGRRRRAMTAVGARPPAGDPVMLGRPDDARLTELLLRPIFRSHLTWPLIFTGGGAAVFVTAV